MANKYHPNLTLKRWGGFPKEQQILNIASELVRAKNRLEKNDVDEAVNCLNRAFELVDITIESASWSSNALRELWLFREVLSQFYLKKKKEASALKEIIKVLLYFNKTASEVKV